MNDIEKMKGEVVHCRVTHGHRLCYLCGERNKFKVMTTKVIAFDKDDKEVWAMICKKCAQEIDDSKKIEIYRRYLEKRNSISNPNGVPYSMMIMDEKGEGDE